MNVSDCIRCPGTSLITLLLPLLRHISCKVLVRVYCWCQGVLLCNSFLLHNQYLLAHRNHYCGQVYFAQHVLPEGCFVNVTQDVVIPLRSIVSVFKASAVCSIVSVTACFLLSQLYGHFQSCTYVMPMLYVRFSQLGCCFSIILPMNNLHVLLIIWKL